MLAVAAFAAFSGGAAALDDRDRSEMRQVIDRQLDAFLKDDGLSAYAFASPGIQQMFGDQDRFMAMVRSGFAPLYRARRHDFAETREADGGVEQSVRVEDSEGREWDAIYSFERGADGNWKISGCRLVKAPDQSV